MYIRTFACACYLCSRCSLTWRENALECPKGFVSGRPVMMWCLHFVVLCVLWVGVVWSAILYFLATVQIRISVGRKQGIADWTRVGIHSLYLHTLPFMFPFPVDTLHHEELESKLRPVFMEARCVCIT